MPAGVIDLLKVEAFRYPYDNIDAIAEKYVGMQQSFLPAVSIGYTVKQSWEKFLKSMHNYIELKDDLNRDRKDFLKSGFVNYYNDYMKSVKNHKSFYTDGMVSIIDTLLCRYARKKGWCNPEPKESKRKEVADKLFSYNMIGSKRTFYFYCYPIWREIEFGVIAQYYFDCCRKYLHMVDKSTAFRAQLEESFIRFYRMEDPFQKSMLRDNTILVTSEGNSIEIIPKIGDIQVKDSVRPADHLTEVIELSPTQEEIDQALATNPIDYFERAPIPEYRRFLKLTLGIKSDDEIDYTEDYIPSDDEREAYYGGISSVLTSLAYGLISNPTAHGMSFKKFFYNYGRTNTGKSTHYEIMKSLFPESVVNMESNQLLGDESKFNLYKIFNKRWAFIDEGDGKLLSAKEMSRLKALSSKNPMIADRKNKTVLEGINYALIYYASNALPPPGDKAFLNRTHIDEWDHDFLNKNDPRNKKELKISEMIDREGNYIFLTLLSFLSELLKTKKIPVSDAQRKIKLLQDIETGDLLMRWYKKVNPLKYIGEQYVAVSEIYDNFILFSKIMENPNRKWWEKKMEKENKSSSSGSSFFKEETNDDKNNLYYTILLHTSRTRVKSRKQLIEFLHGRGHSNRVSRENDEFLILFPTPLQTFESFFYNKKASNNKMVEGDDLSPEEEEEYF